MNAQPQTPPPQDPEQLEACRNDIMHFLSEAEVNFEDFMQVASNLPSEQRHTLLSTCLQVKAEKILHALSELKKTAAKL